MLPKTHAILGAIFSILIYFIFHITFFNAFLIFFASVFIDFDHYVFYVRNSQRFKTTSPKMCFEFLSTRKFFQENFLCPKTKGFLGIQKSKQTQRLFDVQKKNDFSLKNAYNFLKKETKNKHKPMLHIFHTLEFMILILVLSFFWQVFLFIFIGMIFHSALDIGDLIYHKKYTAREHFLIRYLILKQKYPDKYY